MGTFRALWKIFRRRIPGHFRGLFFAPRAQGDVVEVCLEVARSVRISMIFFFTQCGLFDLLRAVPSWTECFCCARERNIFFFARALRARNFFRFARFARFARTKYAPPRRTFTNLREPSCTFAKISRNMRAQRNFWNFVKFIFISARFLAPA